MGFGIMAGMGYATYTDYQDDNDINGSVGWQTYVGSAMIGGAIGFGLGYFGPQIPALLGSALSVFGTVGTTGTLALAGGGTITITIESAIIGTLVASLGIMLFSQPKTGPIRFSDGTGIDPDTGKPVTEKDRAYEIYRSLDNVKKKLNWKAWIKGKGWRTNHLK